MIYSEHLFRQRNGYACEPTTIMMVASLAITAASAAAQAQQQKAQAVTQENQQNALQDSNNEQAAEQASALRIGQAQDSEATARELEKARLAGAKASSTAKVASGEAGIQGNTSDALLQEHEAALGQYREAVSRQGTLNAMGTEQQLKALQTGTRNQNLQINAPINQPQYGIIALNAAGRMIDTANSSGAFAKSSSVGSRPPAYLAKSGSSYATPLPRYGGK